MPAIVVEDITVLPGSPSPIRPSPASGPSAA